jgi:hypothetical protein
MTEQPLSQLRLWVHFREPDIWARRAGEENEALPLGPSYQTSPDPTEFPKTFSEF